jgi:hypothetical protein
MLAMLISDGCIEYAGAIWGETEADMVVVRGYEYGDGACTA